MILLAPTLFTWLYDPRYHAAGQIAQWLGFGLWFTLLERTSQASMLAAGRSKSLALANAANCFVTFATAPVGFYLWGLEGFIVGWTLGNIASVVVVDIALTREGIDLRWQDAILTGGLIAFVIIGFALTHIFNVRLAWNQIGWVSELLPAALLSVASAAAMYWNYRNSAWAFSRVRSGEIANEADPLPDIATGIVSNSTANGRDGRSRD